MCVWKDKNKWKRGRGSHIFLKKKQDQKKTQLLNFCLSFAISRSLFVSMDQWKDLPE